MFNRFIKSPLLFMLLATTLFLAGCGDSGPGAAEQAAEETTDQAQEAAENATEQTEENTTQE